MTTKKREGFKTMIADALAGKIDLIVTKSVSRFARNTVDSLTTVRLIFRLFLEGMTPHSIAAELISRGIKRPAGKDVWNQQTVRRMLSNEKYKGDALLQKESTVDFLQKKMKKNEGEVPQYYVEGHHEESSALRYSTWCRRSLPSARRAAHAIAA